MAKKALIKSSFNLSWLFAVEQKTMTIIGASGTKDIRIIRNENEAVDESRQRQTKQTLGTVHFAYKCFTFLMGLITVIFKCLNIT